MLGFSHPTHDVSRLQALDSSDSRTRTAKNNSWSFHRTLVYLVKDRMLLQLANLRVTWISGKKKKKKQKKKKKYPPNFIFYLNDTATTDIYTLSHTPPSRPISAAVPTRR